MTGIPERLPRARYPHDTAQALLDRKSLNDGRDADLRRLVQTRSNVVHERPEVDLRVRQKRAYRFTVDSGLFTGSHAPFDRMVQRIEQSPL